MSRKRFRQVISGQGWVELPHHQAERIATAVASPQAESVLNVEGSVRVHRLPRHQPRTDVERVNVSGKLRVTPIGTVKP